MKTYIIGVQREFSEWGYDLSLMSGLIFDNSSMGMKSVCDNKFSEQKQAVQSDGQHNVFPREDIKKLLLSRSCDNTKARTYLSKIYLVVGISLGVPTTALHQLDMKQSKYITKIGVEVWRYTERDGSRTGASKVARCGWSA